MKKLVAIISGERQGPSQELKKDKTGCYNRGPEKRVNEQKKGDRICQRGKKRKKEQTTT